MGELVGKWKHVRDEGFSDYLKVVGINLIKRKLVENIHPEITITVDGNKWSIRSVSAVSDQTVAFVIGEEYEANVKGVVEDMMKCLSTFEDGKLFTDAKPKTSTVKATTHMRQVINGEMVQTLTCEGVSCKRYFKRKE